MKTIKIPSVKLLEPKKSRLSTSDYTIAVAGNPNVGKSTVFNALTGLHQHTGNWPGKTVQRAEGRYTHEEKTFNIVDIPGTYSLLSNSAEEEVARDFICFNSPDAVVVVMDATCIERNLNLTLQILEITNKVVVCLNMMDEAESKKISIDTDELSLQLGGVPVVCTSARKGKGIEELKTAVKTMCEDKIKTVEVKNNYGVAIEQALQALIPLISKSENKNINPRFLAVRMLENDSSFCNSMQKYLSSSNLLDKDFQEALQEEKQKLNFKNIRDYNFRDRIAQCLITKSENIYKQCVKITKKDYDAVDRKIDKFLTSRLTGFPTMMLFLLGIFWITISGANYPSEIIADVLFSFEQKLMDFMIATNAPAWLSGILVSGVYRTLAWVVSVMLPPMAIFFPLFTLLEDLGYLPRIAFNLDGIFKKCGCHGKQALTMCMGFGCNACGIIGCRIIDSPRERIIGILTNNFVPCNGRFPLLISLIEIFFIGKTLTASSSAISALILTSMIILGVAVTFLVSKLLSSTLLKGISSSFALELPPYRKPQVGKILVRSLFDRTVFVLGRAVAVAAPAGLVIWLMANTFIHGTSLLIHCSNFLDPFARCIGLDGIILMAFILGFPANEIVLPIIIMSYMSTGSIMSIQSPSELHSLLVSHGWNYITAICVMLFSLMHFPCGTTCWTIKKETKSLKWTVISFILPTLVGFIVCFAVANCLRLISNLV